MDMRRMLVLGVAIVAAIAAVFLVLGMLGCGTERCLGLHFAASGLSPQMRNRMAIIRRLFITVAEIAIIKGRRCVTYVLIQ